MKLWRMYRLAARDPPIVSPEGVVQGSHDEVVPHCGRTEERIERLVRGTWFRHQGKSAIGGQLQKLSRFLLSTFTRGACHRTIGVRPSRALRHRLQRGRGKGFAGCVDSLRLVEVGGQVAMYRRDVLDNTRESDVTRSNVVPTSGLARIRRHTVVLYSDTPHLVTTQRAAIA